jgi:hypothetical protein
VDRSKYFSALAKPLIKTFTCLKSLADTKESLLPDGCNIAILDSLDAHNGIFGSKQTNTKQKVNRKQEATKADIS